MLKPILNRPPSLPDTLQHIHWKLTKKATNSQYLFETRKTNKMLKRGQIFIDKKIDFHGMILSNAEYEFKKTIIESYKQKKRCLLFVTGKGLHKQKNPLDYSQNKNPQIPCCRDNNARRNG